MEIVMPRLSDSMEEGTVLNWLKSVGDEVAVGDELVEIETDKANMVYESDLDGTLIEIVVDEGGTVPVGDPIAMIGDPSEAGEAGGSNGRPDRGEEKASAQKKQKEGKEEEGDDADAEAEADAGGEAEAGDEASAEPADEGPGTGDEREGAAPERAEGERIKASPLARRVASERGVDLAAISGSGPGGRIIKSDVESAEPAEAGAEPADGKAAPEGERVETAKGSVEFVELTKLQRTVARRMAEAKATAPHFYLESEIDMSRCVEGRARLKSAAGEGDVVPSLNDMVVKACAIALGEHPRANGAYRDGRVELYSRVNVGVAVAARDALVVPTIFDADRKTLREIATDTRGLAGKVREGTITPPELSGGTFTVSNLGMFGVTNFSAVINPPQAAILAVGAVVERPVLRDGQPAAAHLMGVTLACDHRILYGADGAVFLGRIRQLLEEPLALAL